MCAINSSLTFGEDGNEMMQEAESQESNQLDPCQWVNNPMLGESCFTMKPNHQNK